MTAKCNLIIDSCCDLPLEMVQREGVYLVEFPFLFDTEQHLDDFGVSMPAKEFYDRMRKGNFPTTSQISIPAYTEVFERAAQSGIPTVYLSFSSALSGSYNVSLLVRDQLQGKYPDMQLHIVDTKLASVAEGALVYEALRQRDAGLTAEELVEWVEEARYFLNMMFMVDDLESLRRGGRIPDGVAAAGAKLDVKPMLTIDLEALYEEVRQQAAAGRTAAQLENEAFLEKIRPYYQAWYEGWLKEVKLEPFYLFNSRR